jgi:Family of unknown function (DUF6049)
VTRRLGLLALFSLIGTTLIVLQSSPARAAEGDLQLISQNFNVASDGALNATLALPADLAGIDLSTTAIVVTLYQRVDKREDLTNIINGTAIPRPDDTVTISPGCCAGPQPGQFTIAVPLETAEVRPDALSIPRAGLYPVTIAVQSDSDEIAHILTFINRLPALDEDADSDSMAVAVAIGTNSAVHLDSKATISLDDSTVAEMTKLADALDVLDANKFPATIRIAPAVLNGLQQLNSAVFDRLIASLQHHQVVAEPQWPLDPSAAAVAKQELLYTSWRRDGQELFADLGLGAAVVSTSTILVDQPLGAEGAALRWRDGARLMVVSPGIYDGLHGTIKGFTDNRGELVAAELPNDITLDVAVVDHGISQLLVHPLATPAQTSIYAVAGLLALRQFVEISGASVQRHAVVIGADDLGVPDPQLLGSITGLIAQTPGLAATSLDDVALRTDRLLVNNGQEAPVTLPSSNADALNTRLFTQGVLNGEIDAVASMLPDDSDKPKGWRDLAELLPTTALDDLSAQGMVTAIRAELDQVRGAVQMPAPYTINLPGKRSTVRVRFVNNYDVPLKIKVRLSSPPGKLVFDNDPQPVVLEPGVPLNIPIDVEARSNGTSGVSLDVFTPNDVPLGTTVPLQFRVNVLDGNVVTGVLFALVLLWWVEHFRAGRKKRRKSSPATLPDS